MFKVHRVGSNSLSVKNLILLFLTIFFGFASVITLAQVNILSSIDNAWQTIGGISITSNGTDNGILEMEVSSGGLYINSGLLIPQTTYSGKILGIDDNGNIIYVSTDSLITSGAGGIGAGTGYWSGAADDIYNTNIGNIGIGTQVMSGKLHIADSGLTELYLEETNPVKSVNINLKNSIRTRAIGGNSTYDVFYIGELGATINFAITPNGYIGIGTVSPKTPLQIVGNLIVGDYSNNVTGNDSTVLGGSENTIEGTGSFIGGGHKNEILGSVDNSFIGGGETNTLSTGGDHNFIGGGQLNKMFSGGTHNFIGGGISNEISTGNHNFLGGGDTNHIIGSDYSSIDGGRSNTIQGGSQASTIAGGRNNVISGSNYSLVGGIKSAAYDNNSFVRNSDVLTFFKTTKPQTFIINAVQGVGIRTNNPKGDLDIAGKGVLVLEPQISNPQGSTGVCTTTGSIVFQKNANKLCFCDGAGRIFIDGSGPCIF